MVAVFICLVCDGWQIVLEGGDAQAGVELCGVVIDREGVVIDFDLGDGAHGALDCYRGVKRGFQGVERG